MKKNLIVLIALLAIFATSCSEEFENISTQSTPQPLTRAGYD